MATLSREHVIAAMLVTGVVVIVGFASGLGLRSTTSAAQSAAPGLTQTPPSAGTPLPGEGLPQAIQPPAMSMPGTDPAADEPAVPVASLPGDSGSVPSLPVSQPGLPSAPGQPGSPPGTPTTPGTPGTPATPSMPGVPPACLPGLAQQVADTANTVVTELPVVGDLTGTLGLTQAPDQSSPGALNTLLYTVTGYCAPTEPAGPAQALTSPLDAVLPKAGG